MLKKWITVYWLLLSCTVVLAQEKTTLIRNVWILDGSGAPAVRGAVRISGEKILASGNLTPLPGENVIDGKGKTLAPGFIDSHSHHYGDLNAHPDALPPLNQGITTIVVGQDGGSTPMDSMAAFFSRQPVAVNVASYTGHATLREMVMGEKDLFRTATAIEISSMKEILHREMQKGSFGLSTGLEYEEGFWSSRAEVIALATQAAADKGRYISHIRSEDITLDDAVDEIISIGRITGMPVQLSHIKIAKKDRWGGAPALLLKLQAARAEGINITADVYPYTFWNSTLRVLFPKRDYDNLASAEFAVTQLFDTAQSVLAEYAPVPAYKGKTITAIAQLRKETTAQTLISLVRIAAEFEEQHPDHKGRVEAIVAKSMAESDVTAFIRWPYANICSDGYRGGHPRGMGAFTRVLARYVREQHVLPLETAVFKMTGLSAEHLGITDRGLIAPGYYADLVLFDPATVNDRATIAAPQALSAGIVAVWVNGQLVYQGQKGTGQYPGKLLKRLL